MEGDTEQANGFHVNLSGVCERDAVTQRYQLAYGPFLKEKKKKKDAVMHRAVM
jgi:hypothetical protein